MERYSPSSCVGHVSAGRRYIMSWREARRQRKSNSSIESGDDLAVGACLIIVPIGHRVPSLPFQSRLGTVSRQPKLASRPLNGAQRTEPTSVSRSRGHRNVQPSDGEGSLTPPLLFGDKIASAGQYRDSGLVPRCCGLTNQVGLARDLRGTAGERPRMSRVSAAAGDTCLGGSMTGMQSKGMPLPPCATPDTLSRRGSHTPATS